MEGVSLHDISFEAYARNENWADVLLPDGLNIIDWIETADEFYSVGKELTKIWQKLDGGIALACLQKNPEHSLGIGGVFTLQRPSLYMTLDFDKNYHYLRIKKARNWRNQDQNPVGLCRKFIIKNSINIEARQAWIKE